MFDLTPFRYVALPQGFEIVGVGTSREPMVDALGRDAVAQTRINGKHLWVLIRAGLTDHELSVTLYHEILEAMTVALDHPPTSVQEFNEADFESAAYAAHERLGPASPQNLKRMLQSFGFQGE